MKKVLKRVLACALAVAMIFQYLPEKADISTVNAAESKPTIGKQVNLAQSAEKLPTAFDTSTNKLQYINLGAAEVKGNTWYYSGTFSYENFRDSGTGGLTFIFGQGTYSESATYVGVTVRPVATSNTTANGSQAVIWRDAANLSGALSVTGGTIQYSVNTNYTFTVKVSNNKLSLWINDTSCYDNVDLEGVTNLTPAFGFNADGTKGTISDIKIWDDVQTNIANRVIGLPTVFNSSNPNSTLNFNDLKKTGDTWYYSAKYTYTYLNPNSGSISGMNVIFGTGTKTDKTTGTLSVTSRPYMSSENTQGGSQKVVWYDSGALSNNLVSGNGPILSMNQEHRFTIKISGTKLTFWINDSKIYDSVDLEDHGIESIEPLFGIKRDGADGTLSDIQVWGDLETATAPVMGKEDVNLTEGRNMPTSFVAGTTQTLDLGLIQTTSAEPSWYYSGTINYSGLNNGTGFAGITLIFGEGTYNSTISDLAVTARPHTTDGTVDGTQMLVWAGINSNALHNVYKSEVKYSKGVDYTYTVVYSGGKVSLWIDDILMIDNYDLASNGVTNIKPKFGWNPDGSSGSISDIKVWGDIKRLTAPVMGPEDVNLTEGRNMPTSFVAGTTQTLDLGLVQTTSTEPSWYYSGTFNYSNLTSSGFSGLTLIFGEGTYNSVVKELAITARPHTTDGTVDGTHILVWGGVNGKDLLNQYRSDVKYSKDVDYTYTVVYSGGKVSLWIDDSLMVDNFDLTAAGVTNITPKFGWNPDGSSGSISNIKVWGDIERLKAPVMSKEDVNLAEGRNIPTSFVAGTTQTLDLGKIVATSAEATWYYSGKFNYTTLAGGTGGLTPIYAQGDYDGANTTLSITARPTGSGSTQVVVWAGGKALHATGNNANYVVGVDYIYTVVYSGGKVSLWIDDSLIVDNFDLLAAGVTNITPKFGWNPDATSGNISNIKVWGDLERVNPATKPEGVANLTKEAGQIAEFKAGTNQYYNNEKINISGDSWYYSGTFEYTSIPAWGGITFVFGEGVYDYALSGTSAEYSAPVVGQRELSVTARAAGGGVQKVLWADTLAVDAYAVPSLTFETGKEYTWTIEVENGLLTFWINDTLVYDEFNLASCGVTNVTPKFGIKPDGSSGTIKNVQIWDATTVAVLPVFATTDTNESLFEEINVTATTGRLQYEGITYNGSYSYSADVEGDARLVLGNGTEGTVEVCYKGGKAYLVEHVSGSDTELASKEIAIDVSKRCNYLVKNDNGIVSFWVNDTLALNNVQVEGLTSNVGVAGEGTGTVTNILLWGDVARETQAILYQKIEDISPYRGAVKTYPQAVGYIFGGWYTSANEDSPVSTSTTSGSAYAKLVPEDVLRVMAQTNKDTTYSSTNPTRLRFVTTVDSKRYSEISFDVTFKGVKRELNDVYVYNTIKVSENEKEFKYAPTYFHEQSSHFYTYSITNISSAIFNEPFTVVPRWTTLDGTEVSGVEREIAINDNNNKRWTTEKLGENGLGGSKLLQLAAEKDANQMMSYVIEAYNPSDASNPYVIVIDGGEEQGAAYLSWLLTTKYDGHVDAWFMSHEHADHVGALTLMLNNNQIGDATGQISIDNLYYNFPDDIAHNVTDGGYAQKFIDAVDNCEYLNGKVTEQEMGHTYEYGSVKITILSDCDEYYGKLYPNNDIGDQNNASIFMLAEFDNHDDATENVRVLFLGDMGKGGEAYALKQANNLGVDLTGTVVQMAHHGNSGTTKAFYDMLKPEACLWPCTNWLWENMDRETGIPGDGTWENVELHQFLVSQGVTEHYTAAYGNYEFY